MGLKCLVAFNFAKLASLLELPKSKKIANRPIIFVQIVKLASLHVKAKITSTKVFSTDPSPRLISVFAAATFFESFFKKIFLIIHPFVHSKLFLPS